MRVQVQPESRESRASPPMCSTSVRASLHCQSQLFGQRRHSLFNRSRLLCMHDRKLNHLRNSNVRFGQSEWQESTHSRPPAPRKADLQRLTSGRGHPWGSSRLQRRVALNSHSAGSLRYISSCFTITNFSIEKSSFPSGPALYRSLYGISSPSAAIRSRGEPLESFRLT